MAAWPERLSVTILLACFVKGKGESAQGPCNPTLCELGLTCNTGECCDADDWECCGTGDAKFASRLYCPSNNQYNIMCGDLSCEDSYQDCAGKGGVKFGAVACDASPYAVHATSCFRPIEGAGKYTGVTDATACQEICNSNTQCSGVSYSAAGGDLAQTCMLASMLDNANLQTPCSSESAWNAYTKGADFCVRVVTGTKSEDPYNKGALTVSVDSGSGMVQEATGIYTFGEVVLFRCYVQDIVSVAVQCPSNDAWGGVVQYSKDAGSTFMTMLCTNCLAGSRGSNINHIVVDGDDPGTEMAASICMNGQICQLLKPWRYMISTPGQLPADARSGCAKAANGVNCKLAMPKTAREQADLQALLTGSSIGSTRTALFWAGASFNVESSTWRWDDGSPMSGYTNWDMAQGLTERGPASPWLCINKLGWWHDCDGDQGPFPLLCQCEHKRATCDNFACSGPLPVNKGSSVLCSNPDVPDSCNSNTCCEAKASCDLFTCRGDTPFNKGGSVLCPATFESCNSTTCCSPRAPCSSLPTLCDPDLYTPKSPQAGQILNCTGAKCQTSAKDVLSCCTPKPSGSSKKQEVYKQQALETQLLGPPAFVSEQKLSVQLQVNDASQSGKVKQALNVALIKIVGEKPVKSSLKCEGNKCDYGATFQVDREIPPISVSRINAEIENSGDNERRLSEESDGDSDAATVCKSNLFCVLDVNVRAFLENAKVLNSYKHYFAGASLLATAVALAACWFESLHTRYGKENSEVWRSILAVILFDICMIFWVVFSIIKAEEKAADREEELCGIDLQNMEQEEYEAVVDTVSGGDISSVLIGCQYVTFAMWVEIWTVMIVGVLFVVLVTGYIACRTRAHQRIAAVHARSGRGYFTMPTESVLRRNGILFLHVWRGEKEEGQSYRFARMNLLNECLVGFFTELVSYFLLQKFSAPGNIAAWYPWKLIWDVFLVVMVTSLVTLIIQTVHAYNQEAAFICVCASCAIFASVIIIFWIWVYWLLNNFFDSDQEQYLRVLDIAVGSGIVGCVLTPLSVDLMFAFASAYFWEPHGRFKYVRRLRLKDDADVQLLRETLAERSPEEEDPKVSYFHKGMLSSSKNWRLADVYDEEGESVKIDSNLGKVRTRALAPWQIAGRSDSRDIGGVYTGPLRSEVSGNDNSEDDKEEQLLRYLSSLDATKMPVDVYVERKDVSVYLLRAVQLMDRFLGVEPAEPVMPFRETVQLTDSAGSTELDSETDKTESGSSANKWSLQGHIWKPLPANKPSALASPPVIASPARPAVIQTPDWLDMSEGLRRAKVLGVAKTPGFKSPTGVRVGSPASPRPAGASPRPAGASPRPAGVSPRPTGASPRPTGASPRPSGAASSSVQKPIWRF